METQKLYDKHLSKLNSSEYMSRYVNLPIQFNNKKWKWEEKDFPRVISLLEFKRFMDENPREFDSVLSFNGENDPEYEYLKYKSKTNLNYEDDANNNDLHRLNVTNIENKFDFCMTNQTLEHLYDPITCLKNINKVMKKDGIFYANAPANNIPHSDPNHFFTGFTSMGLACMLELAGFEVIELGQWGNRDYLSKMFDIGWCDYSKSKYENEKKCPVIVWAFARKT